MGDAQAERDDAHPADPAWRTQPPRSPTGRRRETALDARQDAPLAALLTEMRRPDAAARMYLTWLVRMRWLVVAATGAAAVGATLVVPIVPEHRMPPLVALVVVLSIANGIFARRAAHVTHPARELRWQLLADIVVLTALLHESGGIENPMYLAYTFHVVIAAIVLPRHEAYGVAVVASVLLGAMASLEMAEVLPHYEVALVPHPHTTHVVFHAAHDPAFALGRVASAVVSFHVVVALVTMVVGQLRRRERQLAEVAEQAVLARRRLEGVVQASQAGIALVDARGRLLWANCRYREWLGIDPEATDASEPACCGQVPAALAARVLRSGAPAEQEVVCVGRDGVRRDLAIGAAAVGGVGLAQDQVVLVVYDVSNLKETQRQLVQAGKLAAIGEMAGRIAHELNNPVGIVALKAELLQDRAGVPPMVREELRKMGALARRATRVVQGLLRLGHPGPGRRVRTDVRAVVREVLDVLYDVLAARNVTVEVHLPPEPVWAHANPNELTQVCLNLLNNAADAMPRGGRVVVSAGWRDHPQGRMVCLSVTDSGPGVPAEQREAIFEPFYTTKPPGKGTGLGLAISLAIARAHGGDVEVSEAPGGGAVFTLLVPERPR